MYTPIIVKRGRTTTLQVSLHRDLSATTAEAFSSKIRAEDNETSPVLCAWQIAIKSPASDGILILTIDNTVASAVTRTNGYMDMKEVIAGEPRSVWNDPLPVVFEGVVTD